MPPDVEAFRFFGDNPAFLKRASVRRKDISPPVACRYEEVAPDILSGG